MVKYECKECLRVIEIAFDDIKKYIRCNQCKNLMTVYREPIVVPEPERRRINMPGCSNVDRDKRAFQPTSTGVCGLPLTRAVPCKKNGQLTGVKLINDIDSEPSSELQRLIRKKI